MMVVFNTQTNLFRWWLIALLFAFGTSHAASSVNSKNPSRAPQTLKVDKAKKNTAQPVQAAPKKSVSNLKLKKIEPVKISQPVKKIELKKSALQKPESKRNEPQKKQRLAKAPAKTKKIADRSIRYTRPAPISTNTASAPEITANTPLRVTAPKAIIVNESSGEVIFRKNSEQITPIASVTKLMTGMVILDRNLPMDEEITISEVDVDRLKYSSSRLQVGTTLTRRETLLLALMSSENRAAASLARTYPGGITAFIAAMNRKAQSLGMNNSSFADPTGLNPENVSTAEDLVKMVRAAYRYPTIHEMTTTVSYEIGVGIHQRPTTFINTNRLVRSGALDIGVSKTGYIQEAEHCLVMQVSVNEIPTIMVFLGNYGKYTCQADAIRVSQWLRQNLH